MADLDDLEQTGLAVLQLRRSIEKALTKLDVIRREEPDPLLQGDVLSVILTLREAIM